MHTAAYSTRLAIWLVMVSVSACSPEGAGVLDPDLACPEGRTRSDALALYQERSLVPSFLEEEVRYRQTIARVLAEHVRSLSGVHDSSVFLYRPVRSPLTPWSGGRDAPSVSVIASVSSDGDADAIREEIARVIATTIAGVEPDDIAITLDEPMVPGASPDASGEHLAWLGPFQVGAGSRAALVAMAIALFVLIIALATWALASERINASLRARLAYWESRNA